MRFKWLLILLLLFVPASAFAMDITNPANPFPPKKKIIGIEYSYSDNEMKPEEPTSLTITNFQTDQIFIKGSYGFFEGNEFSLKIGGANARIRQAFGNQDDFGGGFNFAAGVGAKQSVKVAEKIRIGAAVDYTYFADYSDKKSYLRAGLPAQETIDVNGPSELTAALAASYIDPDFTPFAGILASWRRLEVKDHLTSGGTTTDTVVRYKEDDLLGLLLGVEYFRQNLFKLTIEVQVFKRPRAGLSVAVPF